VPHFAEPPLHVVPHVPPAHACPFGQTLPHAPQLNLSESVTVHVPLQEVVPSPHVVLAPAGALLDVVDEQAPIPKSKRAIAR
jgi:hypothetical protein